MIISEWKNSENSKRSILELFRSTFGDSEVSDSTYFDWLYTGNPQGKAIISIAEDEEKGQTIGSESIIPMRLILDNKIVTASLSCNSAVNSHYRKKGIFSKLLLDVSKTGLKNGITCLYAVTNDKSFNAFIRQGATEIISLPLLIRPLHLSKYFKGPLGSFLRPFNFIWKIKKYSNDEVELFTNNYNQDFERLVDKTSKRVSIIQKRDKEFLQWRYRDHPTRNYKTFVLREDSVLRGYIITSQTSINGKNIGVIVDFIVDVEIKNKKKLKDLVGKALSDFWDNGISLAIATSRKGLLENKILQELGFFVIPNMLNPVSLHFIVMGFDSNDLSLRKMTVFDNWFFTFGDYDVF